jgi:hypothetical protein
LTHRISTPVFVAAAAVGCAAIGTGCGLTQRPEATVGQAVVTQRSDRGVRIEVPVSLTNRSDVPLPVAETRYTVTIDAPGARPFRFTARGVATMPVEGEQTVLLPAAFAVDEVDVVGVPYRVTGSIVYESPGEIRRVFTDTGWPLPSVSFSSSGTLMGTPGLD